MAICSHIKAMQVFCVRNRKKTYFCALKIDKNDKNNNTPNILKDSDYQQLQFNLVQIAEFEKRIVAKTDKN